MNTRKRVLSHTQDIYVGPSPASGAHTGVSEPKQLHRIQSFSLDFSLNENNVNEYGQLARLGTIQDAPTVNSSFTYLIADVTNEQKLGLYSADGTNPNMQSVLTNILNGTENEKNYFCFIAPEGVDAHNYSGSGSIIGIGNGALSSYSFSAAVGDFAQATVGVLASNIRGYVNARGGEIPAVDPVTGRQIAGVNFTLPVSNSGEVGKALAVGKGDIVVDLKNAGLMADLSGISVQSVEISFDLSNEELEGLGYKFARYKEPTLPIDVTFSAEVLAGDLTSGNLADLLCAKDGYTLSVTLYEPDCEGSNDRPVLYHAELRNATLQSQNWNGSIGPADTLSLTWTSQIGAANDQVNGLFLSGRGVNDFA